MKTYRVPCAINQGFPSLLSMLHGAVLARACAAGSNGAHDMEKLEAFVEACSGSDRFEDAVIAQDLQQAHNIWQIREGISESLHKHGARFPAWAPSPVTHTSARRALRSLTCYFGRCPYGCGVLPDLRLFVFALVALRPWSQLVGTE